MSSQNGAPANSGPAKSLPPVETPNVRMILQLFIVPGLLVALVIGFILIFFGGVGVGSRTPAEFIDGLNSLSGQKRQQTAHDLAQYLPRQPELRRSAVFALDVATMLQREMQDARRPQPLDAKKKELMDLLEYLPAVAGNFQAPVGVLLLDELLRENAGKLHEEVPRLRFRNALLALSFQGARLQEFDASEPADQDRVIADLRREAGAAPGRPTWARLAADYLEQRRRHRETDPRAPLPDILGIVPALMVGARSSDEMSRKLTILALANWQEDGTEAMLRELTQSGAGLEIFENNDHERGVREIRYNAALALARRGSPLTPDELVLETLDEERLTRQYPNPQTSPVQDLVIKALRDLQAFKKRDPEGFGRKVEWRKAAAKLAGSDIAAVRVEATRLLGQTPPAPPKPLSFQRQLLLMIGVAGSVFFFLAIAVIARWRKKPAEADSSTPVSV